MSPAPARSPIGRFADLAVYAPIGLAVEVVRLVPELTATGRERVEQRIAVARVVGRMAVKMGGKEMKRRFWPEASDDGQTQDAATTPPAGTAADEAGTRDDARMREVDESSGSSGSRKTTITELEPQAAPPATELPIDDYESLAARHVVARLSDLAAQELDLVERFERTHRRRRTVLGKIDQLRR